MSGGFIFDGRRVDDSLATMHGFVAAIQQVEERCRTKMVVHAAWMPPVQAPPGRASDPPQPATPAGSFSLSDAWRCEGPAILSRSGLDLTSPRDFGGGGGGGMLDDEALLHALRPAASASGLVPPLALEGLAHINGQMGLAGDDAGDESMNQSTDRSDKTSRQVVMTPN